ncbi:MAG: type 1 glutamine amidotransferase domain-containing protein [Desulfovibrio sp.]|uniref:type 1 glutamine amidotransferase domain-containing protein n=1 Tax=Desulfovibrio sp. 7SRBS1 TaxID=3378064 RepID=UPI003B416BA1
MPVANLYNDLEFWYPKIRMTEAGAKVIVAGAKAGETYKSKIGLPATCDVAYGDISADKVDGIIIPGGYAPDFMRRDPAAVQLVADLDAQKKLVAFICHAGWLPISAKILKGRTCTSYFAIKDDMINAGVNWVDGEAVVDGNFVSSRTPDDLPAFCRAILEFLK